jgi:hypothetical protein
MNALIAIAAPYFERLTDPRQGREANDSYGLMFHSLMRDDPTSAGAVG